jgi:hypothetical protein
MTVLPMLVERCLSCATELNRIEKGKLLREITFLLKTYENKQPLFALLGHLVEMNLGNCAH